MPSSAANKYAQLSGRAAVILKADRHAFSGQEVQAIYGATFVAQVAAWNAYVVGLVGCFFREVSDPTLARFHAMHTLARTAAERSLDRFNTPNAENTRTLLLTCCGYDPWSDWQWPVRRMNGLAVRERLNEILKVRHSLAHGFPMPGFSWTQNPSGQVRLTGKTLTWTRSFLAHLVSGTDRGMANHLTTVYGVPVPW